MRVPVSWLREYVSFDMRLRELGELLSMTGTELEAGAPDRRAGRRRSRSGWAA